MSYKQKEGVRGGWEVVGAIKGLNRKSSKLGYRTLV